MSIYIFFSIVYKLSLPLPLSKSILARHGRQSGMNILLSNYILRTFKSRLCLSICHHSDRRIETDLTVYRVFCFLTNSINVFITQFVNNIFDIDSFVDFTDDPSEEHNSMLTSVIYSDSGFLATELGFQINVVLFTDNMCWILQVRFMYNVFHFKINFYRYRIMLMIKTLSWNDHVSFFVNLKEISILNLLLSE